MSSAYSQVQTYAPYIPTTDIDLINTALATKQARYDANVAEVDKVLSQFESIDLIRPQDKQYVSDKLQTYLDHVNKYQKLKIGNNNVTRSIKSQLSNILKDPNVVEQIKNTYRIRNYQNSVMGLKEKNPERYSEANYAFGLSEAGFSDYINGRTNTIGELNYRDYTDVGKELKEISENLDKYTDTIKQVTPDGIYYVTKEGKILSPQKVRNIAEIQLSDKAKSQMEINAWANYESKMSDSDIVANFKTIKDNRLSLIDNEIGELQLRLQNAFSNEEKEKINSSLQSLNLYRKQEQEKFDSYLQSNNKRGMAFTMEKESTLQSFANVFSVNNINTSYSTNTAALQEERLKASSLKQSLKKQAEASLPEIETVDIPYVGEETNLYEQIHKKALDLDTQYKSEVNKVFNTLPQNTKNLINNSIAANNIPEDKKQDYIFDYLEELSLKNSEIVRIGDVRNLSFLKTKAQEYYKRYNDANSQAFDNIEQQSLQPIIDTAKNNSGIKILVGDKVQSLSSYLQSNNIKTAEDLNNNPDVKHQILKQFYADMYLSDQFKFKGFSATSIPLGTKGTTIPFLSPQIELNFFYKERLKSFFNNDEKATDAFISSVKDKGAYDTNRLTDNLTSSPIFGGLLEVFNPDNSFADDRTTANLITSDKLITQATNIINQDARFTRDIGIRVNPDSDIHKSLTNVISSNLSSETPFNADENRPLSVVNLDNDYVLVTQTYSSKLKGEMTSGTVSTKVLKRNLPETVLSQINLSPQEQEFNYDNFPNVDTNIVYNSAQNVKRVKDIANSVLQGDIATSMMTTKEETLGRLFSIYPQVLGTYNRPTQDGNIIKNIVQSSNFFLKTQKDNGEIYPSIVYRTDSGVDKTIFTPNTTFTENQLQSAYYVMKYAPQLYLNQMIENMIMQRATGTYSGYYEELKKIYGTGN